MSYKLRMTGISAYKKLNDMAARYLGSHYDEIDFIFTDERLLNDNRVKGYLDYKPADESKIFVKAPFSLQDFPEKHLLLLDSDFVRMGVTMFHEIAHYEQQKAENTEKEILISTLSIFHNGCYYDDA